MSVRKKLRLDCFCLVEVIRMHPFQKCQRSTLIITFYLQQPHPESYTLLIPTDGRQLSNRAHISDGGGLRINPQYMKLFLFSLQVSGEDHQHTLSSGDQLQCLLYITKPSCGLLCLRVRLKSTLKPPQSFYMRISQNFFFPACKLVGHSGQAITSSILGISDRAGMLQLDISCDEHTELQKLIPVI